MLFKIPQNIATTVISILLGSLLFGYALSFSAGGTILGGFSIFSFPITASILLTKGFVSLCLFISIYLILQLNKEHRLIEGNKLPVLIFSAVGFSAIHLDGISVFHGVSMVLSVLSLLLVLKIHNQKSVLGLLFSSSLLIGVASIFYYPIITQLLVVFLTVAFFRPFEIRNYMVTVVGISLPYFYLFCLSYLLDWDLQLSQIEWESFDFFPSLGLESVGITLFLALSIASAVKIALNRSKFIVRQRNQLVIISVFLIIQFLMVLLLRTGMAWLPMIPFLSLFILYSYKKIKRNWLLDVVLLIILIVLFWLKFK